jgi:hypothetical protein
MRLVWALVIPALGVGLAFSACSDDQALETLCEPGTEIFCRCRGGKAGTKQCQPDGQSFGQCYAPDGPCPEVPTSTSSTGSGGGATGSMLLEPCLQHTECQSGLCRMGYCTKDCGSYVECYDEEAGYFGDCVPIESVAQQCVPYCTEQADCEIYGAASGCGWAQTTDAMYFPVCADWPGEPPLPPVGTECFYDWDCNLGHLGRERVCVEVDGSGVGMCMAGCHSPEDCPGAVNCSAGSPGVCG